MGAIIVTKTRQIFFPKSNCRYEYYQLQIIQEKIKSTQKAIDSGRFSGNALIVLQNDLQKHIINYNYNLNLYNNCLINNG